MQRTDVKYVNLKHNKLLFSKTRLWLEMDKIGKGYTEDAFLSQVYQFSDKGLKEEFIIQYLDHLK